MDFQTKTAGSCDPAIQNSQTQNRFRRKPQLAAAAGAVPAIFFSIAFFKSSAFGDSSVPLALIRKASKPPRWSTDLMALVETRRRTLRPSASEMKVTLHRFGRNRRLVLMFEWLTLWPTMGPLAVSSQRRDILQNPLPSPTHPSALWRARRGGSNSRPFQEPRTYRGRAAGRQGFAA